MLGKVLLDKPHYSVPHALFDEKTALDCRTKGKFGSFPFQLMEALKGAREALYEAETERFSVYRVEGADWIHVILGFEPGLDVPGDTYVDRLECLFHRVDETTKVWLAEGEWAGLWMPRRLGGTCHLIGVEGPISIGGESLNYSLRAKLAMMRAGVFDALNDGWLRVERASYDTRRVVGTSSGVGPKTFLDRVIEDGVSVDGGHRLSARHVG